MSRVTSYTGELLMVTGVLHTATGLREFRKELAAIGRNGVINAVSGDKERQLAVWFILTGIVLTLFGGLTRWTQKRTGTLPAFYGTGLLAISSAGVILMPRSGFWLLIPTALLSLLNTRQVNNLPQKEPEK